MKLFLGVSLMFGLLALSFVSQPLMLQPVKAITTTDTGGMYNIVSKSDGQGLAVSSTADGANVYCANVGSTKEFNWQVVWDHGKSAWLVISQFSMKLLEVEGASTSEGANIVTGPLQKNTETDWSYKDKNLFLFEAVDNTYYAIKNYGSGLYLTQDGTNNIVQQAYTGADSQLFSLSEVSVTTPNFDTLVWADEFDYTGFPDSNYWSFEQTFVNNEEQFYTIEDQDNCYVENGYLRITAIKERVRAQQYTSARIKTQDKMEFQYGKVEARIKVAGGTGTWPAFWMLNSLYDDRTNPWPDCGEIDMMEYVGYDPYKIHGNAHCKLYNGMDGTNLGASVEMPDHPAENWHVYGAKWSQDRIVYYVDDWEYFVYENIGEGEDQYPFTDPFFIILNLAIGGDWGGVMGIDDSIFPVSYYVDYVRVYQESGGGDTTPPAQVTGLSATAVSDSQIDLTWDANTESDLDHYNIYRDGTKIAESTTNSYSDTGLAASTTYTYEVSAVDTSGNEGTLSSQASATTDSSGDTTPPAQVTGLTATAVSDSQIDLAWDANSESDLDHYNIYRDGTKIAEATTNSYSDTGLAASTTYTYEVSAVDTSGNEGTLSDSASATTESSGSTGSMHVQAIDMWVSKSYGPWNDIAIQVTVVDSNGNPLSGVTVSLDLELPDGTIKAFTGTTDSNGQVTFTHTKAGSGTYTATVTNLELSGYTYDATANVETSEQLTV